MVTIEKSPRRALLALPVLLLPALLTSMDLSILFVAAPTLATELRPSGAEWLWMMDVYGFVMAGLLITAGSVGDRIGRRRLLMIGAVLFGGASALLALAADDPATFILGRALLGIGGATLAPSTLSLLRSLFPDEARRRFAIGAWTVAFTGGTVAGPIVGGVLLEHFWWGSIFLINIPVMVLLLVAAPLLVPESRGPAARFDLPGAGLSLVGLLGIVYAVKDAAEHGLSWTTLVALVIGATALAGFVVRQRTATHPLMDLGLFRRSAFTVAVGANTAVSLSAAGLGVLAFTFLQVVHDLSPLAAALTALPTLAGTFAGAALASTIRLRPNAMLAIGLAVVAAGFAAVSTQDGRWGFIAGYTLVCLGIGATGTVANDRILGAAPPERAGAAAGVAETSAELGAALGIAVLGTIANALYRGSMQDAGQASGGTVADAVAAPGIDTATALAAYADSVSTTALIAASAVAVVAVLIALPRRDDTR